MRPDDDSTLRMRGGWPVKLGDAMGAGLSHIGPTGLMAEARVRRAWPEAVGDHIGANAHIVRLRSGTLEVVVNTDTWANELRYLGEVLREKLNEACGPETVKQIVVYRRSQKDR